MGGRFRQGFAGRESFELREIRLAQQAVSSLIFAGNDGAAPRGATFHDRRDSRDFPFAAAVAQADLYAQRTDQLP
jgi:hypothetical protein